MLFQMDGSTTNLFDHRYRDPKTFATGICPPTDSPLYRTSGCQAKRGQGGDMYGLKGGLLGCPRKLVNG